MKDSIADLKVKFLEYYSGLPVQKLAADFINRSADTIQIWMKDDIEFSAQVNRAKAEWAQKTSRQVRSKEWLLERTMNDHFGNRIDVTSGGKPIQAPILGGITKDDLQSDISNTEVSET